MYLSDHSTKYVQFKISKMKSGQTYPTMRAVGRRGSLSPMQKAEAWIPEIHLAALREMADLRAEATNGRPRVFRLATRTRVPVHLLHPFWHTFEHLGISLGICQFIGILIKRLTSMPIIALA